MDESGFRSGPGGPRASRAAPCQPARGYSAASALVRFWFAASAGAAPSAASAMRSSESPRISVASGRRSSPPRSATRSSGSGSARVAARSSGVLMPASTRRAAGWKPGSGQGRELLPLVPAVGPVGDVAVLRAELDAGAGDLDGVAVHGRVVVGLGVLDGQVDAAVRDVGRALGAGRGRVGVQELAVVADPHGLLLDQVVAVLLADHPLVGELLGDHVDARARVAVGVGVQAVA